MRIMWYVWTNKIHINEVICKQNMCIEKFEFQEDFKNRVIFWLFQVHN
jgi:hypothetical protein